MGRSVLVVDDEPVIRMDLRQMLTALGYDVVGEAGDGFDAQELCRRLRPDVVLMDLSMPTFGGMEAAEAVLREDLAGCVVVVTAYADGELIEEAGRIGVTGYLVKPVEERLLLPTIEIAWSQRRTLLQSRDEAERAKERLEETRLIARAQTAYAQEQGLSLAESYQALRRMAMERRCSMGQIAQALLARSDREAAALDRAKRKLSAERNISPEAAYRLLARAAETGGEAPEAAARRYLREGRL